MNTKTFYNAKRIRLSQLKNFIFFANIVSCLGIELTVGEGLIQGAYGIFNIRFKPGIKILFLW